MIQTEVGGANDKSSIYMGFMFTKHKADVPQNGE